MSTVPPLSRSAHDRAAEHRDDQVWLDAVWPDARVIAVSQRSRVPIERDADGAVYLRYFSGVDLQDAPLRLFLGQDDDTRYFAVRLDWESPDLEWTGLREIGGELSDLEAGLVTTAVALMQWHTTHDHCPRCGTPTEVVHGGWSRSCPKDGSQHFPRTDPAVIMLVHDGGDRCVLGRQGSWPEGRFSVLAGFVEAGESSEAAVAREVDEEVGLAVTDIRYVASQPWPFPASLMLGFIARVEGDEKIILRDNELAEADWFTRDELRRAAAWGNDPVADVVAPEPGGPRLAALPGGISIARQLVELWLDGDGDGDGDVTSAGPVEPDRSN